MEQLKSVYLIIGGGPVGIQAAKMLRKSRPESSVIVLRPEPFSVIYCAIPYAIEGIIDMKKIAKKDELVTGTGAQLIKASAKKVNFDAHLVTLEDGRTIKYNKLLIATGALPFIPPVPGNDLRNILTVKTAADAEKIKEKAAKAKKVVVIGAGAIGLEQAQAMKGLGKEVHLVDMAAHPLPAMVDKEFGEKLIEELAAAGVAWHGNSALKEFSGKEFVEEVVLDGNRRIKLDSQNDFVIVSVGIKPELEIFKNTKLEMARDGIKVDALMRTSVEDVFAAGDCVSFYSGIDNRPLGGKLATNAVPMAKVAAVNMVGQKRAYQGFFNGAVTCLNDMRVGGTGFTEAIAQKKGIKTVCGFGQTTSRFPIMPGAQNVRIKLVAEVGTSKIIGGQIIGPDAVAEKIDLITFAIQKGHNLTDLANLSYSAQPWQTFFPAANPIVKAAEDALAVLNNKNDNDYALLSKESSA
ncbi:MAG: FAD-dependent oxidoreductase [Candidatus Rifleibacteriota bacterium]